MVHRITGLILLCSAVGCSDQTTVERQNTAGNFNSRYKYYVDRNYEIKHGSFSEWTKRSGIVTRQGTYRHDVKDGAWKFPGDHKGVYQNGREFSGNFFVANSEGAPIRIESYKDGVRNGTWHYFYDQDTEVAAKTGRYDNDDKNGKWTLYYPDGQKWYEGDYRDGKKHDLWVWYHRSQPDAASESTEPTIRKKIFYRDGIMDGLWELYAKSTGKAMVKGAYKNNLKSGEWTYYYRTGNKSITGHFDEGEKSDHWQWFDQRGNQIATGLYADGVEKSGTFLRFGKNEYIAFESQYENGKMHGYSTEYHQGEKTVKKRTPYREGLIEGKLERFSKSGELLIIEEFAKGKKHGKTSLFWSSTHPLNIEEYRDGKRHGKTTWYEVDGQKTMEGYYKDDKRDGQWIRYDANLKVIDEDIYLAGKCVELCEEDDKVE